MCDGCGLLSKPFKNHNLVYSIITLHRKRDIFEYKYELCFPYRCNYHRSSLFVEGCRSVEPVWAIILAVGYRSFVRLAFEHINVTLSVYRISKNGDR